MNAAEQGFLLLTSQLGDPQRRPLTSAQLRILAGRVRGMDAPVDNRHMVPEDLVRLGYAWEMAQRIVSLLSDRELLEYYLRKGSKSGCVPLTRVSGLYPKALRRCLGDESPGCLWAKGDLSVLSGKRVSLVGSRDLCSDNRRFAELVGFHAAEQGYVLVSGNARGADKTAQEACLAHGGSVISVVADSLEKQGERENVLYLSEDGFDVGFSSQRALSRNRVIHCLGEAVFVAQSHLYTGGTWDGTARNLRHGWSRVCCYADGSAAAAELEQLGARLIGWEQLKSIASLTAQEKNLFDQ